jgi:hypothetical protein
MREIRTSGSMSGERKRSGDLAATAPLLDSTHFWTLLGGRRKGGAQEYSGRPRNGGAEAPPFQTCGEKCGLGRSDPNNGNCQAEAAASMGVICETRSFPSHHGGTGMTGVSEGTQPKRHQHFNGVEIQCGAGGDLPRIRNDVPPLRRGRIRNPG